MFGRRSTSVVINRYLDAYQQNESLPSKLYRNLSSTVLKAVKKDEQEVAHALEEGNPDDHSRHEDYILSYAGDQLKSQVYSFINRGIENCHTISVLKDMMSDVSFNSLLDTIKQHVKRIYVQPNKCIYDPAVQSSADCLVLIFLRHGEGYYVANEEQNKFEYLDCVDMLGVTDHCYVNSEELSCERVKIVSQSACLVGLVNMSQIIEAIKSLDTTKEEIDNVVSFLLARSIRLERQRQLQEQEMELKKQETLRRQLAEWREYLKAGDLEKSAKFITDGFDVNSDIGILRDKPLFFAVMSKSLDVVKYLCTHGANVQEQNEDGSTALHIACQIGWLDGVKYLLSLNADLMPDKAGNFPTHIAAQHGYKDVVMLFVQLKGDKTRSINFHAKNAAGESVVDCCNDIALKKIIVPKGIQGYSFAHCCVCFRRLERNVKGCGLCTLTGKSDSSATNMHDLEYDSYSFNIVESV